MERLVHGADTTTIFGIPQAGYESRLNLGYGSLSRHIRHSYLAALQSTLADNVRLLMDDKFAELSGVERRAKRLAIDADVGRTTVYRIIDPEKYAKKEGKYTYPGLDTVAKLARSFSISVPQLLTPDFAAGHIAARPPKKRSPAPAA